jgi:REP-associated tyrosine transposase
MPRRTTPFLPDQYYHFYNRGNNRQAVFFDRDNYLYFLRGLKQYIRPHVDILVYCLMPTHYHMLGKVVAQTSEFSKNSEVFTGSKVAGSPPESQAISRAMQKFGISYTKAINKRFERVGSLFQGQFQGKPIQQYNHLINLCVYIHANPVKDGLVKSPEDWEFSNYQEWMNLRQGTLVNRAFITENFGTPEEYKKLVMEYIKTRHLPDDVKKYLQNLEG